MSAAVEMTVAGVGLFMPGFADLKAWRAGQADPAQLLPTGKLIAPRVRRRTSVLTRALADVYEQVLEASGFPATEVASVFGSALGEADTMIGVLDQIFREGKSVSPMRFAMSVHNAAGGVVSTVTKNRGFTTSLGADFDTPAMALAEAAGLIATGRGPVVVVCGDEQAPKDLVDDEQQGWDLLAVAVALRGGPSSGNDVRIRAPLSPASEDPSDADQASPLGELQVADRVARNPQMGLLDLVAAIQRGGSATVRLDRGRGRGLCAEVLGG